jgi:hypothetical protein
MAIPVDAVPTSLAYPGVMPGSFGPDITPVGDLPSFNGGVRIRNAPVAASVTFTLVDETGHFSLRDVYVLEWVSEIVRGGDGNPDGPPPGHGGGAPGGPRGGGGRVNVLEVAGTFDGKTPVAVAKGQDLLVRIKYAAGTVEGFFDPVLIIQGDTWETVKVQLSLFPAQVVTSVSDTLNIAQGGQAQLAVTATSAMGPQVDITYAMSTTQLHTGLTLQANTLTLERGQSRSESLTFQADRDAPLGPNQVAITQTTWRPLGFFISANIVHARITVNPAIPNKIRLLRTPAVLHIPLEVHLNGGPPASVGFSLAAAHPGVSMQGGGFQAEQDVSIATLDISLPANMESQHIQIQWSAFNGEQGGVLDFDVTIAPETWHWSVSGQTTPATLGGWAELWMNSDGFWSFRGHVHDSGFFDLFYASLVVVNPHDANLKTPVFQQNGSVTGSGNPFGSNDDNWTQNGQDPFISDNWDKIKTAAATFRLHAQAEAFDVLEVVLAPEMLVLGLGKAFVEQVGQINIGGGSPNHSKVECETIVTNDGFALHCAVNG